MTRTYACTIAYMYMQMYMQISVFISDHDAYNHLQRLVTINSDQQISSEQLWLSLVTISNHIIDMVNYPY